MSKDENTVMTINGTVDKTATLLLLTMASAFVTWMMFFSTFDFELVRTFVISGSILGLALAFFIALELPLIHENTFGGIIFSIFVIVLASANLVVDFDFIEQGADNKAPKYMEWYGAFGLLVTVIWLYVEILRLLAKSRKR